MKIIFLIILIIIPSYVNADSGWYNCRSWDNNGGFLSEWNGSCNGNGGGSIPNNAMTFNGSIMTFNGSIMTFTHS